jgi:hypothetical protein
LFCSCLCTLTVPPTQIVSTFLHSLDIPWPSVFGVVMARVNIINLNLGEPARALRFVPALLR